MEPPGVIEDRAIEMARQRNALEAQGSHRFVEEMKRRTDEVKDKWRRKRDLDD